MKKTMVFGVFLSALSLVPAVAQAAKRAKSPDELPWNYVSLAYQHAYLGGDVGGGAALRFFSDSAYRGDLSVLLTESVFFQARYDSREFADDSDAEVKETLAGLGFRAPTGKFSDFFVSASYEKQEFGDSSEADGVSYELGFRAFLAGSAEASISYRYADLDVKDTDISQLDRAMNLGVAIPLGDGLSLIGRAEIGSSTQEEGSDEEKSDTEAYLIGVRFNFNL